MAKDERSLPSLDTEPPPPSGDAYSAETVQRQIPPELLAAAKAQLVPRAPKMPTVPRPPRPAAASSPGIAKLSVDEAFDEAETQLRPIDLHSDPSPAGAAVSPPPEIAAIVGSTFGAQDPVAARVAADAPAASPVSVGTPHTPEPLAIDGAMTPSPRNAKRSWSWMVFFIAFVVTLFFGIVLRTYFFR